VQVQWRSILSTAGFVISVSRTLITIVAGSIIASGNRTTSRTLSLSRDFLELVVLVSIYSFVLLVNRGVALIVCVALPVTDFLSLGILTSSRLFYIVYLSSEIFITGFLLYVSVRFRRYHSWLQQQGMSTYQHIQKMRDQTKKTRIAPLKSSNNGHIISRVTVNQPGVKPAAIQDGISSLTSKDAPEHGTSEKNTLKAIEANKHASTSNREYLGQSVEQDENQVRYESNSAQRQKLSKKILKVPGGQG
jgi:hypothetical protein